MFLKASAVAFGESFIEEDASVLGFPLGEGMNLRESSTPSEWLLKDLVPKSLPLRPISPNEILILVELSSWSEADGMGSFYRTSEKVELLNY
jgi:hypothetical protein